MNAETEAFLSLMMSAYSYGDELCQMRRMRAATIIFLQWGIEKPVVKEIMLKNNAHFKSKTKIKQWCQDVRPEARLKLFTVCMDILSSGGPLNTRQEEFIQLLKDELQVNQLDFDATMKFCSNRVQALGIQWVKK